MNYTKTLNIGLFILITIAIISLAISSYTLIIKHRALSYYTQNTLELKKISIDNGNFFQETTNHIIKRNQEKNQFIILDKETLESQTKNFNEEEQDFYYGKFSNNLDQLAYITSELELKVWESQSNQIRPIDTQVTQFVWDTNSKNLFYLKTTENIDQETGEVESLIVDYNSSTNRKKQIKKTYIDYQASDLEFWPNLQNNRLVYTIYDPITGYYFNEIDYKTLEEEDFGPEEAADDFFMSLSNGKMMFSPFLPSIVENPWYYYNFENKNKYGFNYDLYKGFFSWTPNEESLIFLEETNKRYIPVEKYDLINDNKTILGYIDQKVIQPKKIFISSNRIIILNKTDNLLYEHSL